MRDESMDLYLNCETCLRLWANYGVAILALRARDEANARSQLAAVLKVMRAHEAEAHLKGRANAAAS
jgi:hypothetical protein